MSALKKRLSKLIPDRIGKPNSNNSSSENVPSVPSKEEGIDGSSASNGASPASPRNNGAQTPERSNSRRVSREILEQNRARRSMDKERSKAENKKRQSLARIEDEKFLKEGPEALTQLYRPYSMIQSKHWRHEERALFKDINWAEMDGQIINFRARMHTLRRMSAKLVFIVFRQQTITIQGVLQSFKPGEEQGGEHGTISEQMVRTVEHYPAETIVVAHAKIRKSLQTVKNATVHDYELQVYEIHRVVPLTENVPFTVYDAENINREKEIDMDDDSGDDSVPASQPMSPTSTDTPRGPPSRASADLARHAFAKLDDKNLESRTSMDTSHHQKRSLPQRVRLNNRIIDLRTTPAQAIFRIQSGICNLFRSYLDTQGFIEIHTPKLQGGATESGATVFELNYFGRSAFLAQSPQLAKQMCIAADFERVYEIGAVFRAEDSNTPRHLTEYTGLDLEMALEEHYHEALTLIDGMFKNLWKGIYDRYQKEIDLIDQFYPHTKVEWLDETPRISFSTGVKMLVNSGWVEEDGSVPSETEDLSTRAEIRLGALVKEKYHTDYYILDKFPASVRPFYTMPDPDDDRFTNSFDIFMRGQEILTGGQRIHDAEFLEKRMKQKGIKPESMPEYLEGFRWGAPPHAGCGIGLERLTYLFLSLGNIRLASLFPRDPKSLPPIPPTLALRHEDASTLNPVWEKDGVEFSPELLPPLEKLIANYGDAANTSWLDKRYHVWRHSTTGAAQGYVIHNSYAIIVGEPLCDKSQTPSIVSAFLNYLNTEHKNLKPIWMIVGPRTEEYLGEKFGWRTLSPTAEERADPRNNPAAKDNDLARKVRHAEKEGIKLQTLPFNEPVPDDFKEKVNARVVDWQKNRKGTQVHLTEIRPWVDEAHRKYFYAQGSDGTIHAINVLHQLSPENGYQVKFSLEFPNAPSGTVESLLLYSMKQLSAAEPDVKRITFGTGAQPHIEGGRNLGKHRIKALKKAYETIVKQARLLGKSEFREKMGTWNDAVYVAYPKGGLGAGGIRALMGFLEEDG
ncbi:7d43471b-ce89-4cec-b37f-2df0f61815f4 [Sclerotinia trifoliorum]|uniref:aspartate--tRNA ligase n=1 Tax=Sclerotinia trifoliorum TaxID=28548 RepID=A0A8H2VT93_9HELO|nr:7d43471b-ce89-4cec-b37f-2df0f61815f4 [Sclerotinia trifoliorum]